MTSVAEENKRVLMDLEVVLAAHDCPHIVRCYGCFITDVNFSKIGFIFTLVNANALVFFT